MNVLFIDPYLSEIECNVGLGYLCAVLKTHGHHCRVIACAEGFCKVSLIIQEEQPDIIGFSVKSSTVLRTVEIALEARKLHDGLLICGGPHITIDGKAFLKEHSCFDIGVAGEGEDTILEIIDYLHFETEDYPCKERIKAFMKGNLQLFNYNFVRDISVAPWSPQRLFPLFALIVKYDGRNILRHISRMTRGMFSLAMKSLRR
jgi:radical SAM superfamily enzyme YgiQ (UPF0313 family)